MLGVGFAFLSWSDFSAKESNIFCIKNPTTSKAATPNVITDSLRMANTP
jgi:hypothetical protein